MQNHKITTVGGMLLSLTLLSGAILSAPKANADTSATVDLTVNVPAACSLTPANTSLTKTINPGTSDTIGTSNLKAVCNDPNGFAIYAIGYTNNTHGNTDLITDLGTDYSIHTGTGTSASNWNMTITNAETTGNYTATIENGFNEPHVVPDVNTKIATVASATDQAIGTNLTATFNAYIAPNQVAGTYEGKVKFTLVHPADAQAPASRPATLDAGVNINIKMKNMANGTSNATYNTIDSRIKSIAMADTLPDGFVISDANTISSASSEYPIYIFFDNTNNAGIMNIYTEGAGVSLNTDSSHLFGYMRYLSDLLNIGDWSTSEVTSMREMFESTGDLASTFSLDLSNWDTSKVVDMGYMFNAAGQSASTWSIGDLSNWDTSSVTNMDHMFTGTGRNISNFSLDLSNWDTSNVTNMNHMFYAVGYSASTWSIGDLSNWNTSSVTNMGDMFDQAGYSASTWSIGDLSDWDTSNVTNMGSMFYYAGYNASTFSLDLSSWDTSNVTNMNWMFYGAGHDASNWSITIPRTNGNGINNTASRIYGKTSSTYVEPDSGKSFTIAQ